MVALPEGDSGSPWDFHESIQESLFRCGVSKPCDKVSGLPSWCHRELLGEELQEADSEEIPKVVEIGFFLEPVAGFGDVDDAL